MRSDRVHRRYLQLVGGSVAAAMLALGCSSGSEVSPVAETQPSDIPEASSGPILQGGNGSTEEAATVVVESAQTQFSGELEPGSVTAADLDRALVVLVECLRPVLNGVIRVNFDRYLDFSADYALPDGRNDPQASEQAWDRCDQEANFLEKDFVYRQANRLSVDQIRQIGFEFGLCAETAGFDLSLFPAIDTLATSADVGAWRDDLYRQVPSSEAESLLACGESVFYGPPLEF